jgi:membrane-anchored protein YejM (alkaline phosphatase superfamily)
MPTLHGPRRATRGGGSALRGPALVWALLHGALAAALFAGPLVQAVARVPPRFAAPLYPAFLVQAASIGLLAWLATLPLSLSPRLYRVAFPALTALGAVALGVDAVVYRLVSFHINGFFFTVVAQPGALRETGVPYWQAGVIAAAGAALVAAEIALFPRFAAALGGRPRRTWRLALALLAAGVVERFAVAALAYYGGPGVFAAGQVLPLQAPVRTGRILAKLEGRNVDELRDPFSGAARDAASRMPAGLPPGQIRFTRTPDVLFVVAESLRGDFFDERTMPRLFARARDEGAVFARHYSNAPATFYGIFSLLFGLEAHKANAVLGAGRAPILFPALQRNGYQVHLVSASSVDWMGLRDGVFGDVKDELETDWDGPFPTRDEQMLKRARAWVERAAPDRPVFLWLFFFGTHFDYFYPPRSAVFAPAWDGKGSVSAARAPPEHIKNRARNAAHEVDWKLAEFLAWFEGRRGRKPLLLFTGDHGEEFREKGRIGHGSGVNVEQLHTPMVVAGEAVPRGRFDAPTSHADVVPTLFGLLGDTHAPEAYSDGMSMYRAPRDRFVLATVGWEPTYAAIGSDVKVQFGALSGFGRALVTDPQDAPLPDGAARFPQIAPRVLELLGRDPTGAAK